LQRSENDPGTGSDAAGAHADRDFRARAHVTPPTVLMILPSLSPLSLP
jgi:hypothetical protein